MTNVCRKKQTMALVVTTVAAGTRAGVLTVVQITVLPPRVCWRGPATQQYIRTHMAMGITTQKRMKKKTDRPTARPAAAVEKKIIMHVSTFLR